MGSLDKAMEYVPRHFRGRQIQPLCFWYKQYTKSKDHCFKSVSVSGTTILTTIFYWIAASGYLFIDLTGYPKFLAKYKIQPTKNAPLEWAKLWKVSKHVLVNQVLDHL